MPFPSISLFQPTVRYMLPHFFLHIFSFISWLNIATTYSLGGFLMNVCLQTINVNQVQLLACVGSRNCLPLQFLLLCYAVNNYNTIWRRLLKWETVGRVSGERRLLWDIILTCRNGAYIYRQVTWHILFCQNYNMDLNGYFENLDCQTCI